MGSPALHKDVDEIPDSRPLNTAMYVVKGRAGVAPYHANAVEGQVNATAEAHKPLATAHEEKLLMMALMVLGHGVAIQDCGCTLAPMREIPRSSRQQVLRKRVY